MVSAWAFLDKMSWVGHGLGKDFRKQGLLQGYPWIHLLPVLPHCPKHGSQGVETQCGECKCGGVVGEGVWEVGPYILWRWPGWGIYHWKEGKNPVLIQSRLSQVLTYLISWLTCLSFCAQLQVCIQQLLAEFLYSTVKVTSLSNLQWQERQANGTRAAHRRQLGTKKPRWHPESLDTTSLPLSHTKYWWQNVLKKLSNELSLKAS